MEADERRKYRRQTYENTFHYQVSVVEFKNLRKIQSTGVYIDTSETGLGFMTGFELEPGHIIRIIEGASYKPALIKWCKKREGRYRVGGKYV